MKAQRLGLTFGLLAILGLSACGGGGGGGAPAVASAPGLDSVATLSYKAKSKASKEFTPWEQVDLEAVVTGTIGTATRTFSADRALPNGLSLNTTTGAITGLDPSFALNSPTQPAILIRMTASGFSRDISASPGHKIEGLLTEIGSCQGGFALTGPGVGGGWACSGTTGVAGTINFTASYFAANTIGAPFPVGTTFAYSLLNGPAGATINPATGVISWTPTGAGSFVVKWAADVSNAGVTRRYESGNITLTII